MGYPFLNVVWGISVEKDTSQIFSKPEFKTRIQKQGNNNLIIIGENHTNKPTKIVMQITNKNNDNK